MTTTDAWITKLDAQIVELISNDRVAVPPYPAAATTLHRIVESDDYNLNDLVEVVSTDQMLAAATLRYANSAAIRPANPVTSVQMAVSLIGAKNLVTFAFGICVGSTTCRPGPLQTLRREVWRHAVMSAEFCRQLARQRRMNTGDAFACGLLHDFGKAIGLACIEKVLESESSPETLTALQYERLIEHYHVELGMVMAAKWQLPDIVCDVISGHHADSPQASATTKLVVAADQVVSLLDEGPCVTMGDLADASEIQSSEYSFVLTCLHDLPGIITALDPQQEAIEKPVVSAPEVLWRPETTLEGASYTVDFPITATEQQASFEALYLTPRGLAMRGRQPLPEQTVVRLSLEHSDEPLDMFVTVTLCTADNLRGFRIEARPLAMDTRSRASWDELYERISSTAQPAVSSAAESHAPHPG